MTTSARTRYGARMWLVGVASVMTLALTGCGGGGESHEEVATVGKPSAGSSGSGGTSELAEYVEAQRKWVACLRKGGVDVPDPDARGKVDLGDQPGWKRDPKALKAQEKCADFSVPVPESVEKAQQPELSAKEKKQHKEFAHCMQEHGASDFPDTDKDGNFQDGTWDMTSAGAKRAQRTCGSIIGVPTAAPSAKG